MSDVEFVMTRTTPLKWKREYRPSRRKRVVVAVKAWAPDLDPSATLPPYYRITQLNANRPTRLVHLHNCRVCGGDTIKVDGLHFDLAAAKVHAQADYDKRRAEQTDD